MFDIFICFVLFGKVVVGLVFYKEKSFSQLRFYMALRYIYNMFTGLVIVMFNYSSSAYPLNYLACIAMLAALEMLMLLAYSSSLCRYQVEEALEGIDGFKLTQRNT